MSKKSITSQTLPLSTSANGTDSFPSFDKNSQFVHYQFKDTAIWVRGSHEEGFYLTVGDYRLTDPLKTPSECENLIKTRNINLLCSLMEAVYETIRKHEVHETILKNANFIETPKKSVEEHDSNNRILPTQQKSKKKSIKKPAKKKAAKRV